MAAKGIVMMTNRVSVLTCLAVIAAGAVAGAQSPMVSFELPIDATRGGVTKFIITPTIDSCHWGMLGLANEWLLVEMADAKRIPYARFQPVVLFGRLTIDPQWRGAGLAGLYELKADYACIDAP
jgi:hypothetical protein